MLESFKYLLHCIVDKLCERNTLADKREYVARFSLERRNVTDVKEA